MARRLAMTGEVVDAARAERIGLVTEVSLTLNCWSGRWSGPVRSARFRRDHGALKGIYTTGAAPMIDPALAAEAKIAFLQHRDFDGLGDQFREVSERNKRQIDG